MIRSAITISLVPQARGGPFVFHDDLDPACHAAAELGYDAVELFLPSPDLLPADDLRAMLDKHHLKLAAVGTGAGWVVHQLSLTSADGMVRESARQFVRRMIDLGALFGAPAIIGSIQGRASDGVDRDTALGYLRNGMDELGEHAGGHGLPLLYEPLNRYETNLCNTVGQAVELIESMRGGNVKILADLFHMNIEEVDIAAALRRGWKKIGHLHFADSNRRPVGCGHTAIAPIVEALHDIGFGGYASAEVFPWPDSLSAARQNIEAFRQYLA